LRTEPQIRKHHDRGCTAIRGNEIAAIATEWDDASNHIKQVLTGFGFKLQKMTFSSVDPANDPMASFAVLFGKIVLLLQTENGHGIY